MDKERFQPKPYYLTMTQTDVATGEQRTSRIGMCRDMDHVNERLTQQKEHWQEFFGHITHTTVEYRCFKAEWTEVTI